MHTAQPLPFRRLPPVSPQTFADEADRARLSSVALTAFRSLVTIWGLSAPQAAALLAVSPSTWERMRRGEAGTRMNQDQLTRVSALVGILKGLRLLFADDLADRWPQMANKGAIFGGLSPVAAMVDGGIPRMLEVRRHVDALRGGM
ncbi:antitoxin Xre-like helix-turn-helix domain-containing protein [Brevundimonas sp.]|uniref:antitoxin Xre-like helix-turn-helix domain-containing protein n=1 Tax=Brevundimonas sp. TaxID=1871086 RepID=UPI0035B4552A